MAHLNLLTPFLASSSGGADCASVPIREFNAEASGLYSRRSFLIAEIRREESIASSGLSTAALAHADEVEQQDYTEKRLDEGDQTETTADSRRGDETDERTALFSPDEANTLRGQWDSIQVGFVDEPRRAVERADQLVAGAMKRLAEMFAAERSRLEGQWDRGDSVSTEELRLALRRYRAFFGRLLSV